MANELKLNGDERNMLAECCACEDGKGILVNKVARKVARSLTRKGLTYTLESVFMVCIATAKGRELNALHSVAS